MKSTLRFLIPAFILLGNVAFAQPGSGNLCGTKGMTKWFEWYRDHRTTLSSDRGNDTTWYYIPMTIQITGDDAGNGYYSVEDAIVAVDNMNRQYKSSHIRYYLTLGDPFRFLNKTYWHVHDWDGGSDLINSNRLPNRLNAFVVADPAGNCGYSWQDAIVLGKNCSGPANTTWAHEAGHHFSLPHPFYGWEGTTWNYAEPAPETVGGSEVEKTDGSNCYTSGDFFCDTRPDYLNYRWDCNQDRESNTLQHDPNGVEFRSDATLFMGYALDACANRFSDEQITAIRDNIALEHYAYLQLSEPLQEISDSDPVELVSPIDTASAQFNNVTFSWNPVPNASLYTVEVALYANNSARLMTKTVYNTTTLTVTKGMPNNRLLYWRVYPYSEWDLSKQLAAPQVGVFKTKNFSATNELERVLVAELSPNPVSAGATAKLLLSSEENMDAALNITDASGRRCHFEILKLHQGDNMIEIPTAQLNAGLYFISLQNEFGTILKRLAVTE